MKILVTGGAGYIGSHTVIQLINAGHEPIIIDDLSNSSPVVLDRIESISGVRPIFYRANILDRNALEEIFKTHDIDAVIHFAGFKAVGESVEKPIEYYYNNVSGTLVLLDVMKEFGIKNIIFSSSATVYGDENNPPMTEDMPKGTTTNPYGESKSMVERILSDLVISDSTWSVTLLRYFNPVGAHESGLIGEDPSGIPNNLLPYVTQVAIGKLDQLSVYGDDYDTVDGTGVRDYIHVEDLAAGHIAALQKVNQDGVHIYNLGTGNGVSVLELVHTFEKVNHVEVPYKIVERRAGDIATSFASAEKAKNELAWQATHSLEDMLRDSWHWQSKNPHGYSK